MFKQININLLTTQKIYYKNGFNYYLLKEYVRDG